MSTLTVPVLTQTLDELVLQQVAEQGLTEEEHQRRIWDYYEQECLRSLESGQPIPLTQEYWNEFLHKRKERKNACCAEEKE